MKKFLLFITAIYLFFIPLFGQEGLLIRNIKSGKTWMYERNSRVTYILFHEQEYSTGIIKGFIDSSAVVLGKDTVTLKDIAGIRKKNPLHRAARMAGMPLMLLGCLFMGEGAASIYSNPDSDGGIQAVLLGAGVFALGYLPYGLSLEDLTVGFNGEWTIRIFRDEKLTQ